MLADSRSPTPARPGPAWSSRRARRRCQPLAMPVMSALPAPKVKGAGANHSPSVLPAGIRQRREAEPCSRPNKSLLALAAHAGKRRVLRADRFRAIILSRRAHRCRGPPGPESFSVPRPCCSVTRSGRKGHSQGPTFLFLPSLLSLFTFPRARLLRSIALRLPGVAELEMRSRGDGRGPDGERGGWGCAEGPFALLDPSQKHLRCQGHCLVGATSKMSFKNLLFAAQFRGCFLSIGLQGKI